MWKNIVLCRSYADTRRRSPATFQFLLAFIISFSFAQLFDVLIMINNCMYYDEDDDDASDDSGTRRTPGTDHHHQFMNFGWGWPRGASKVICHCWMIFPRLVSGGFSACVWTFEFFLVEGVDISFASCVLTVDLRVRWTCPSTTRYRYRVIQNG